MLHFKNNMTTIAQHGYDDAITAFSTTVPITIEDNETVQTILATLKDTTPFIAVYYKAYSKQMEHLLNEYMHGILNLTGHKKR